MPRLRQLHLHMNKITETHELCRPTFEQLDVLDLGNNKIQEIPVAFVHFLANLSNLCLINNDLQQLPPLLGFHAKIQTLQVDGNPLKTLRR